MANFNFSDKPCIRRPSLINNDAVKIMLEPDPFLITSEMVERLDLAKQTISDHIQKTMVCMVYSIENNWE